MIGFNYLKTKKNRFFRATNSQNLERIWSGERKIVAHLLDMVISRHLDAVSDEEYFPRTSNEFQLFNHQEHLANTISDMVICEYHINKNLLINELGYKLGQATIRDDFLNFLPEKVESVS